MSSNYPIDIHIHKLLDWLISRKICDSNWIHEIKKVRDLIRHALKDMPEHKDIANILSGNYLHYFNAVQIVEILKQTEADTKNIFGMYGSSRMNDWLNIIKLYEKKNLYLAESSDILLKDIKYEIPNYKKHINKLESNIIESKKRINEYEKNIQTTNKEFILLKNELGVEGELKDIKDELKANVNKLPEMYEELAKQIKTLEPGVIYYIQYSEYVLEKQLELPLLQHIIEKGNTTTFEYKYKKIPTIIEEPIFEIDQTINVNLNESDDVIDWGDDVIDWGDNGDENKNKEFEIVVENDESVLNNANTDIAKGNEALTILDNEEYKLILLNEIYELQSFYNVNYIENNNTDNTNINIKKSFTYKNILNDINNIINSFILNKQLIYLQNIKHSIKYLNNILKSIVEKYDLIEKYKLTIEILNEKIDNYNKEINIYEINKNNLIENTKQLKVFICNDISKKYNNTNVDLIGKIY